MGAANLPHKAIRSSTKILFDRYTFLIKPSKNGPCWDTEVCRRFLRCLVYYENHIRFSRVFRPRICNGADSHRYRFMLHRLSFMWPRNVSQEGPPESCPGR
jgi:hypothetical protein